MSIDLNLKFSLQDRYNSLQRNAANNRQEVSVTLFDRFLGAIGLTTKAQAKEPIPFDNYFTTGSMVGPTGRKPFTSSWVASDATMIARAFSTAEFSIYRQKGSEDEEIYPHEATSLWFNPNPHMGNTYMMQFLAMQLVLRGDAYIHKAKVGRTIAELWPIPSWQMEPVSSPTKFIDHFRFTSANGGVTLLDPDSVIYCRLPHPENIFYGWSPIEAARAAIDTDAYQVKWNQGFFGKRNAIPSALAIVPPTMTDNDYKRVREELFNFYGSGNREIALTRAGTLDFKILGPSIRDMDFRGGREASRDEIDRTLGVPGGFWNANATEANATHAEKVLINHTVYPMLKIFQEDLNAQWVSKLYGRGVYCKFSDIRPRNQALDMQLAQSRSTYWTIDELRAVDGKPPLEGGRGNRLAQEVSTAAQPVKQPQNVGKSPDTPPNEATSSQSRNIDPNEATNG